MRVARPCRRVGATSVTPASSAAENGEESAPSMGSHYVSGGNLRLLPSRKHIR